jgi:hypothetical protein
VSETYQQWRARETKALLLLWQRQILSDGGVLAKLLELGWTSDEAERLLEGAYLLLPVM